MAGQQERKESRAAMAGRQNGKTKGKGKEVEGEEFGHQFCRVLSAQEYTERLRIPPSFSQYLRNEPLGLVCLLGQSGNPWLVELASDTEGLFFRNGWKEFVMDHSIEEGDILTFCYYRRSHFSVVVFDEKCTEKPSAFHAQPSIDVVDTTESDGTKRNRAREIDANSSTLRKRSNGSSVVCKSANFNSTKESISSTKSSKSFVMLRFSKDVDIRGKTVVKVQKQPAVMSQRPPVSEAQKNYALEKAKQYKWKYPITLQIMKECHVYNTFFMIIPCEFVREYLPQTDKKLTLWDPQGKAWEVTYVYCRERCAGAFSGGWGKFSVGNHLEEFDVCVFELFLKDNIKVHIYRADVTLTPYLLVDSSNE
ncbi:unnamed protein product [Alopecurus aequalis]